MIPPPSPGHSKYVDQARRRIDQTATDTRIVPAIAIAAPVDSRSASGPVTSDGMSEAAETIDASTPKTRPRTSAGVDSVRFVCAVTDVTAYAAPATIDRKSVV